MDIHELALKVKMRITAGEFYFPSLKKLND